MNIGTLDRWLRIIVGTALIVMAATDVLGLWAYIGIIPLATGIIRWCPLYTLIGIQTCPLHETVKR
ncbi:MAG: YgaP family membrane protein [Hydrogenovibrio sp.]